MGQNDQKQHILEKKVPHGGSDKILEYRHRCPEQLKGCLVHALLFHGIARDYQWQV